MIIHLIYFISVINFLRYQYKSARYIFIITITQLLSNHVLYRSDPIPINNQHIYVTLYFFIKKNEELKLKVIIYGNYINPRYYCMVFIFISNFIELMALLTMAQDTRAQSHSHMHMYKDSSSLTYTVTLTHTNTLTLIYTLAPSHSYTHDHTHTRTHKFTLTHTHSHSPTHLPWQGTNSRRAV